MASGLVAMLGHFPAVLAQASSKRKFSFSYPSNTTTPQS